MVYICDACMGSGKSQSAILFMNEHPDEKFVYITPYLDEAERIRDGCPKLRFVEPSDKIAAYGFKKTVHTAALIKEGRNIATTHQAFRGYTPDMLDRIREQGYTLIIDENVEILEKFNIHPDDIDLAVSGGYIVENNGVYTLGDREYNGNMMSGLFRMMRSREMIRIEDGNAGYFYYWSLTPELVTSFKDTYILTYLFDGQSIHHFLEIYRIPYERIGVKKTADGEYRFTDDLICRPAYLEFLKDRLHILDHRKMNDVGEDVYALSKNWFERDAEGVEQLRKNLYNYYRNVLPDREPERRLWGSFKSAYADLRGKGYSNRFLVFNTKATNRYRSCDTLAYLANVFMNAAERRFYTSHGVETDQDMYALSTMVQWIWRSAIRDGGEVDLYVPSSRMRGLLENWIDSFGKEVNANV